MTFSATIEIARTRQVVWQIFTDSGTWARWWGGTLNSVDPGWRVGGTLVWELGGPSKISECAPLERVTMVSSTRVRCTFTFLDAGHGRTAVTYSEDYAGASVFVIDPARRQAQCQSIVANLRRFVESPSLAPGTARASLETTGHLAAAGTPAPVEKASDVSNWLIVTGMWSGLRMRSSSLVRGRDRLHRCGHARQGGHARCLLLLQVRHGIPCGGACLPLVLHPKAAQEQGTDIA